MKKTLFSLLAAALFTPPIAADNQLVINELMQSNVHRVYAEYEFPDSWVELYNPDDEALNIKGYAIGDSEKFSKAYILPDTCIAPLGHILIYCDKEEKGLHTDFRVESGKGSLYLFNPAGDIIDEISFAKMPAPDVAYGRAEDNSDEWGYMITTTPGCSNAGGITTTILPQPLFSEVGGLKTNKTQLTISLPDEELPDDVALCVTLDGHEPQLSDKVDAPYELTIDTTTVVRAKLLSNEAVSPLSLTHSYIYYQQASENPLPVISITTNHEYLYNEEWGILGVPMEDFDATDINWRRPINIEYFIGNETLFNQVGETRVQGNFTRRFQQRSLAVYANKRFGEKRYNVTFWKDKPHVTKVKSFTLRNGGNDFKGSHIKDAFAQTLAGRHCDNLDWMAYQPCICFINGVYKGIYDIRERSNEDYIEANYDGLEDIDMFENWNEKKVGSRAGLDSLFAAINDSNVTFEKIDSLVDLEELNNNFIINSFITNTDYPNNNHVIWRNLTVENSKWEFVMKDLDRIANEPFDLDYFKFIYELYDSYIVNPKHYHWSSGVKLYSLILENEQLCNLFLDRYIVYLGDFLQYDTAMNLLYEMRAEIEGEYYNHCLVYFEDADKMMGTWNWHYNNTDTWWAKRLDFMKGFLAEYFELGEVVPVTINVNNKQLKINDIPLTQDVFKGAFYSNRMMHIAVEEADCTYNITTTYKDGTSTSSSVKSQKLDLQVTPDQAAVTIEINTPNGIIEPDNDRCDVIAGDNVITVNGNRPIEQVVLYDTMGRIVAHDLAHGNNSHSIRAALAGVYIVQVRYTDGNIAQQKVVVK